MKTTMENSIVCGYLRISRFKNVEVKTANNEKISKDLKVKKFLNHPKLIQSLFLLGIIFLSFNTTFSQNTTQQLQNVNNQQESRCLTSEKMLEFYQLHPEALVEKNNLELRTQQYIIDKENQDHTQSVEKSGVTYTIPVVFHVYGASQNGFSITLAKIQAALVELNKDFNGLNSDFGSVHNTFMARRGSISIEFALALKDPNGNVTTGVEFLAVKGGYGNAGSYDSQIAADAWDNYKYMNVYIQGDIYNDGGTSNSGVAWYPSTTMSNAKTARVVYNGAYLGTNTDAEFAAVLTHEFGHFMNLAHTFDISCSSPINDNVSDTPPCDEFYDATDICHPTSSSNLPLNCTNQLINAENYMDYRGRLGCYKMFTQGQITRIEAALQDPARITLWQTSNLIATGLLNNLTASVVISTPTNPACSGSTVTFTAVPTNGGTSPSYQWKVNGSNVGTNSSTFSTTTLTTGQVVICVMTSNFAGVIASPATSSPITMTVSSALALPLVEGFQGTFVPTSWTTNNPNGDGLVWSQSSSIGNGSTKSTVIDNFTTSGAGTIDELITPKYSFTGVTNATLTFDVAYARYSSTNYDSLIVYASSDCGTSWTRIYAKGNSALSTAPDYSAGIFTPSSSQWRTETISMLSYAGQSNVALKFQNKSGYGQALYIDNVNMAIVAANAASVLITQTGGTNPACSGSILTYTAVPTNGGSTPVYQWKVNGVNAGTNSPIFTTTSLTNGQIVTCVMTSNLVGVTNSPATSLGITMIINSSPVASVSIGLTTGNNPMCIGANTVFTATPINGGSSPSYQWQVNGANVGTNFPTYTTAGITNGQIVTCLMTSNLSCASPIIALSSGITMVVNSDLIPSISVAITSGSNPTCLNANITFTATPTNGGTSPSYQWKVNGVNAGTNSSVFSTTSLTNGQIVTCIMTSNALCASPLTATSSGITMVVNAALVPSVSIAITSGSNPTCSGASLTFTATPTNGGTSPSYQWQVNGVNAGTNTSTFTSSTITNNQIVTCVMTSSSPCASPLTGTSSGITMIVYSALVPSVSIAITSGSNPTCSGASLTFTATPTNGGTTPSYQWKVNGVNAGTNSSVFSTTSLTNGQIVTCIMTSNALCASPLTATSSGITVVVNSVLVPSVSIAITSGSNPTCSGASLTFTATPTNGGTTPSYQWQVNGVNAGTNSSTFTSSTLTNNQIVTCVMTSSSPCASSLTGTSSGITIQVNSVSTPTGSISQTFCSSGLVSDLIASGLGIQWYATSTGGAALQNSTTLVTGNTYYAAETNGNCISSSRLAVVVSIINTPIPSGSTTQSFCPGAKLTNVIVSGNLISWYSTMVGGIPLSSSTLLVSGTTYYATQTVTGCESSNRLEVTIVISSTTSAPTGSSSQSFCGSATVANLNVSGMLVLWYNSATGGIPLLPTDALSNGSNYYASQTIGNCESLLRLPVSVYINIVPVVSLGSIPTPCLNDAIFLLTQGSPIGGVYSGVGVTNGLFDPSVAGLGNSVITYSYTNINLCTSTAQTTVVVDDCIGLIENGSINYLIYPNPANDNLTIAIDNQLLKSVKIYDELGRVVITKEFLSPSSEEIIDVSNMSNGSYSIQVILENGIINKHFSIVK